METIRATEPRIASSRNDRGDLSPKLCIFTGTSRQAPASRLFKHVRDEPTENFTQKLCDSAQCRPEENPYHEPIYGRGQPITHISAKIEAVQSVLGSKPTCPSHSPSEWRSLRPKPRRFPFRHKRACHYVQKHPTPPIFLQDEALRYLQAPAMLRGL